MIKDKDREDRIKKAIKDFDEKKKTKKIYRRKKRWKKCK